MIYAEFIEVNLIKNFNIPKFEVILSCPECGGIAGKSIGTAETPDLDSKVNFVGVKKCPCCGKRYLYKGLIPAPKTSKRWFFLACIQGDKDVRDCLKEDQKKGIRTGGSRRKGRKKKKKFSVIDTPLLDFET